MEAWLTMFIPVCYIQESNEKFALAMKKPHQLRQSQITVTRACLIVTISLISMTMQPLWAQEPGQSSHPVRVGVVEHRPVLRKVSTYGVLAPRIEDLSFRIDGRIQEFMVREGQTVAEGEVLAQLETRDAKDALERAELDFEQAKRQYARFSKLADEKLIQTAQLENAEDTLDAARIGFEQAVLNLERCTLVAPANGIILKEYVESRTTVMAGRPIYSFRDVSGSWITKVELTDRNAFVFGTGTRAIARFAPYVGEVFEGELTKQAGVADEADSLYTVEITIATHGRELRPGMVVEIDLIHETETAFTVVPLDAMVDLRGNAGVIYLLEPATSLVEEVPVHIASITGNSVALIEPIQAGRQVVIRGQQSLRHGAEVNVIR